MNEWQRMRSRNLEYVGGLHANGMHDFILLEAEVGFRVALAQDSEDSGWSALSDMSYLEYVRKHRSH
jgi:hypothetical protein